MNILYLHDTLHGGAAESLVHLIGTRPPSDNIIVAYGRDGPVSQRLASLRLKTPPIKLYLRSWLSYRPVGFGACVRFPFAVLFHLYSLFRLFVICRRRRVQVIHSNCIHLVEGALLSRLLRIPHVWSVRELLDLDGYQYEISKRSISRSLSHSLTTVLCNSSRAEEGLVALGVAPEKIQVLPNIVRAATGTKDLRSHLKLSTNTQLVAITGWITPIKRALDFVQIASSLAHLGPDVKFLVIGASTLSEAGYYDEVLRAIQESPNRSNILCVGEVENVASYLSSLTVLIHPGSSEAFGRVIAESLMGGTPVIGVRGSAVEEIIDHNETGFLVTEGDVQAMAHYCCDLLHDPEKRKAFGERGARRARSRFSEEALAPQYNRLYDNAVVPKSPPSRLNASRSSSSVTHVA